MTIHGRNSSALLRNPTFIVSIIIAELITLAISIGPLLGAPWWKGFRAYFSHDQLSYAAIATNVSQGNFATVEPLTETGVSHYPSLWYCVIGSVSWLTHIPVWIVWTVLGIAILSAAVLTVGTVAARVSGKAWVAVLPALALLTGTASYYTVNNWYTPLDSHAVIWAPYASLFTLNGEVAGISIAVIAMALLVDALFKQENTESHRTPKIEIWVSALLIGLLANVQTYTFFSITLVIAIFVAARDLTKHPSRARMYLTIVLGFVVLWFGKSISQIFGPLPLLASLFLSMAPVLIPAALRAKRLAIPALLITALAASPEVVRTAIGVVTKDPFLTYREASSTNLGILEIGTLVATTTWVLLFVVTGLGLWRGRQAALSSLVIALALGFIIMPANDIWGFNQEPYRSWIQFATLSALLLSIPLAWGISRFTSFSTEHKVVFAITGVLAITSWGLGLQDFKGFWDYAKAQGIHVLSDSQAQAIQAITTGTQGLVLGSQCMDPQIFKLIAKKPVPYYNLGLAWPANKKNIDTFRDPYGRQPDNPLTLKLANVKWVVTDSSCVTDWNFPTDQRVVRAKQAIYQAQADLETLTLWNVNVK
ncbi:MAG: hypothetical protein PHN51_07015 [Candidatus Nanopelagicales bacterium]|nr:hypothetical protein [Candidatus Nanopelagicales bacterium]